MANGPFHPPGLRDLRDFVLARGLDLNPHPLFDIAYYLSQRPDLVTAAKNGLNMLEHYLAHGAAEGTNPHSLFDTRFYMQQAAELEGTATSPLVHFLAIGWRKGIDPHPLFSLAYYVQRNPAAADANPVLHCLARNRAELGDISPWFDAGYYLAVNPDIALSNWTPFDHYMRFGIAEGRAGSPLAAHMLASRPEFARPNGILDLVRSVRHASAWAQHTGPLTKEQAQAAAQHVAGFRYKPSVSLLLHVAAEDQAGLDATLASITGQTYPDWQLCVALDPGVPDATRDALLAVAKQRPNVSFIERGWSGDPAFALNAALEMARGELVGVVLAGDSLHRHALAALIGAMQGAGVCDIVYGDEDTVDPKGLHGSAFLKPDWSPEYLLSCDYLSRLGLFRAAAMRRLGGFRPGFDAGCIHDLSLRASSELPQRSVRHVPVTLYHTAHQNLVKRRAGPRADGIHRAIASYLEAERLHGQVVRTALPGHYRVILTNRAEPLVSVVIPTANASFAGPLGRERVLDNCIRSIKNGTIYRNIEIVVVHDGNLLPEQIAEYGPLGVRLVLYDKPVFNFSEKVNVGAQAASGEYLLILNDDVEAKRPDWLNVMLGHAERPGVGVVGAKLFFPDGRLQHTGVILQQGSPGHPYYRADGNDAGLFEMNTVPRNYLAVTGACQLVRRSTFDALGGYDESLPLNYNDVDFCLRAIEQGSRIVYAAGAELYHFEGITKEVENGNRLILRSETELFLARWRSRYPTDPFYHPDLPPYMPLGYQTVEAIRRTPQQARTLKGTEAAKAAGINFLGPVNRASGLGTASRSYIFALQQAGLSTRIVNLDKMYGHQAVVEHELVSVPQDFPVSLVQANADATPAMLAHYGEDFQRAVYRVGIWVWELPAIRPDWQEFINKYDEIWVPTQFCHDAFKPMTRKPVTIVPYALSRLPKFPANDGAEVRENLGIPKNNFVFLFMFDAYSFVDRKNPTCLLDAFEAEFRNRDDITLVLKVSYFDNLKSDYSKKNSVFLLRLERFLERCRNVVIVSDILPERDVYRLLNAADCYVSPHRSEGFGLTVAEAMYYGKPVIATDFGGTRDLVVDGAGLKLRYSLVELAEDMGPYLKGNIWAEPQSEHLQELMCGVVADPEMRERHGVAAHKHVTQHFSPQVVGRIARKRVADIAVTL